MKQLLSDVFEERLTAVLATSREDEPYSCLVSFVVTDDMKTLLFSTKRKRLKYQHMDANPRVSLLVDNRENSPQDLTHATSVTIIGGVEDVTGERREGLAELLLKRHPNMKEFIDSPDCAIMEVKIDRMVVVTNFETVVKIEDN
jgi:nitroimidazol reductase NimA-like FMN-containing flavoprotein (pyridoxamine 5'-phosphate oxidase superfamily)